MALPSLQKPLKNSASCPLASEQPASLGLVSTTKTNRHKNMTKCKRGRQRGGEVWDGDGMSWTEARAKSFPVCLQAELSCMRIRSDRSASFTNAGDNCLLMSFTVLQLSQCDWLVTALSLSVFIISPLGCLKNQSWVVCWVPRLALISSFHTLLNQTY